MSDHPSHCPNLDCRHARRTPGPRPPERERFYRRKGSYPRLGDGRVARFQCKSCGRHFSEQTFAEDYREKKPELDPAVERLARAGCSARRAARLLGVDRKTVLRRYHRLGALRGPRWRRRR